MGNNRASLLSELNNTKSALRAAKKRGERAQHRLRDLKKILDPLIPKIEAWLLLPVSETSHARVLLTSECRVLLSALKGTDEKVEEGSDHEENDA